MTLALQLVILATQLILYFTVRATNRLVAAQLQVAPGIDRIAELYTLGAISRQEAGIVLTSMGYTATDAQTMLDVWTPSGDDLKVARDV